MATVDIVSLSGSYTHCKPLFSLDGKLLFTSCGSILQILSTQTGELIHRLYGHSANITSIIHHPTKSNHVRPHSSFFIPLLLLDYFLII